MRIADQYLECRGLTMYKRAVDLIRKDWLPILATALGGMLVATLGASAINNSVIALLFWLIVVDVARTYVLIRLSGKEISIKRIAKRLWIDAGFLALLGLILIVLPFVFVVAKGAMVAEVVVASTILWYYFIALYIVLSIDLFYAGYLAVVEDKGVIEAVVESAGKFRKDKAGTIKKAVICWAPALIFIIWDVITNGNGWVALIIMGAGIIPLMEATYAVACGCSNLKNQSDHSSKEGA